MCVVCTCSSVCGTCVSMHVISWCHVSLCPCPLWIRCFREPATHWFAYTCWSESPRHLPVSTSWVLRLKLHTIMPSFFRNILGIVHGMFTLQALYAGTIIPFLHNLFFNNVVCETRFHWVVKNIDCSNMSVVKLFQILEHLKFQIVRLLRGKIAQVRFFPLLLVGITKRTGSVGGRAPLVLPVPFPRFG